MSKMNIPLTNPVVPPVPEAISEVEVKRITISPAIDHMNVRLDVGGKPATLRIRGEQYNAIVGQLDLDSIIAMLLPTIEAEVGESV